MPLLLLLAADAEPPDDGYLLYSAIKDPRSDDVMHLWRWGHDIESGVFHQRKALACSLADSKTSNRQLVVPSRFGLDADSPDSRTPGWVKWESILSRDALASRGFSVATIDALPWVGGEAITWLVHDAREAVPRGPRLAARRLPAPDASCRHACSCCYFSMCEAAAESSPLRRAYDDILFNMSQGALDPPAVRGKAPSSYYGFARPSRSPLRSFS